MDNSKLRTSVISTPRSVNPYHKLPQMTLFSFVMSIIILKNKSVISFLQSWTDPTPWFLLPTTEWFRTLTTNTNGSRATPLLYLLTFTQPLIQGMVPRVICTQKTRSPFILHRGQRFYRIHIVFYWFTEGNGSPSSEQVLRILYLIHLSQPTTQLTYGTASGEHNVDKIGLL